jgi:hypothetical protein
MDSAEPETAESELRNHCPFMAAVMAAVRSGAFDGVPPRAPGRFRTGSGFSTLPAVRWALVWTRAGQPRSGVVASSTVNRELESLLTV